MSFSGNTLYGLTWNNIFKQSCELRIKLDLYAGSSTSIKCAHSPIIVDWMTPTDYILDPINGSKATLHLIAQSNFQFADLFTNRARKYKVEFLIESVMQGEWFIQPDQYQAPYRAAPYSNSFIATDQLGYLKTIAWDRDTVETEMVTIGKILEKTGLELDLWEGVNVYENSMDSTAADSPFNQAYINTKVFADTNYYVALENILRKYSAIIKQEKGKWVITRPEEMQESYTRRLWTYSAGVYTYDSNESYNPVVLTTAVVSDRSALVKIGSQGSLRINPAWKDYTLTQDLGRIENILNNGDFTEWSGGVPANWQNTGISYSPDWRKIIRAGNKLRIPAVSPFLSAQRWQQSKAITGDVFTFRLRIKYFVRHPGTGTMTIRFGIRLSGGVANQYYHFEEEEWKSYYVYYVREVETLSGTEEVVLDIITKATKADEASTVLYLFLFQPEYTAARSYIDIDEVSLEAYEEESEDVLVAPEEEIVEEIELSPENNYEGIDQTLMLSDLPTDTLEPRLKYRGGVWLDAAQTKLTGRWSNPLNPYARRNRNTLIDLLKITISRLMLNPQKVLSITIYSTLILPGTVIREVYYDNNLFLIKRATWDPMYGSWKVEAYAIGRIIVTHVPDPIIDSEGYEESSYIEEPELDDALLTESDDFEILGEDGEVLRA